VPENSPGLLETSRAHNKEPNLGLRQLDRAVIVAVIAVWVMQVPVD
jgi:hypothetical protein